jgi:hypothetical protein
VKDEAADDKDKSAPKDNRKLKKDGKSKDKKKKDNMIRKTLTVLEHLDVISPPLWSPIHVAEARTRLRTLQALDDRRQAKEAALNDLEGYIYR